MQRKLTKHVPRTRGLKRSVLSSPMSRTSLCVLTKHVPRTRGLKQGKVTLEGAGTLLLTKHVPRTRGLKLPVEVDALGDVVDDGLPYQTCSPHTGIETSFKTVVT